MRFASPEDILIHTIVTGRPRDIEDARAILAKSRPLDRTYVLWWLGEFERTLSSPLVEQFKEWRRRSAGPDTVHPRRTTRS